MIKSKQEDLEKEKYYAEIKRIAGNETRTNEMWNILKVLRENLKYKSEPYREFIKHFLPPPKLPPFSSMLHFDRLNMINPCGAYTFILNLRQKLNLALLK